MPSWITTEHLSPSQNGFEGVIKFILKASDDPYYLAKILKVGDQIRSKADRKITNITSLRTDQERKVFTTTINLQTWDLPSSDQLIVNGVCIDKDNKNISEGQHHSFTFTEGASLSIFREDWDQLTLNFIRDDSSLFDPVMVVMIVEGIANIFSVRHDLSFSLLQKVTKSISKKTQYSSSARETDINKFIGHIVEALKKLSGDSFSGLAISSPNNIYSQMLLDRGVSSIIKNKGAPAPITTFEASSGTTASLKTLLNSPQFRKVINNIQNVKVMEVLDRIMHSLNEADDQAVYGVPAVLHCVANGSAQTVVLSGRKLMSLNPEERQRFHDLFECLEGVDVLITTEASSEDIDNLTGIAAYLYYPDPSVMIECPPIAIENDESSSSDWE